MQHLFWFKISMCQKDNKLWKQEMLGFQSSEVRKNASNRPSVQWKRKCPYGCYANWKHLQFKGNICVSSKHVSLLLPKSYINWLHCGGSMVIPYEAWAALISYNNWSRRQCNATMSSATQRNNAMPISRQYRLTTGSGMDHLTFLAHPSDQRSNVLFWNFWSIHNFKPVFAASKGHVHCIRWCRKDPTSQCSTVPAGLIADIMCHSLPWETTN